MSMEFWRLPVVMQRVGLSKTEIYRQMKDGRFPRNRLYPGTKSSFWVSAEIIAWQIDTIGSFEDLLK